jgi:outer membrane protein OmpA-like peptidoglycan-associated protein
MARRPVLACLLVTLVAATAMAQEVRHYRPGEAVDPREAAAILSGSPSDAPVIKTRSIRLLGDAATATAGTAAAATAGASALSLPVQFAFDSSQILPAARSQLDALADGIRLLPENKAILIEGHTDAMGSAQYNQQLSLRRAQAVKNYLVAMHRLDPQRLRTAGRGEERPKTGVDPNAADNRRVEFHGE